MPAGADDDEPGIRRLGLLVQRARGARAPQLAALELHVLRLQLLRHVGEPRRAVGDEVLVHLTDGDRERGDGDREHRRARLDGRHDEPGARQAGGRDPEADRRIVRCPRVIAGEDGPAHRARSWCLGDRIASKAPRVGGKGAWA
jgi:hypothetical protein